MSTASTGRVTAVLLAIRQSFLAFVTAIGVGCCLLAVLLSEYVLAGLSYGVLAGMFAIWGVSAFVYAVVGHLGLRLIGYR
ncbi:hypothetical protein [Halorussus aquaticus]|uniref:Uncharacterized protein n=1 Tax=Halorussus aquaticus TaxID=2953748 RepID=A0ABD5Q890_9EURY|nr:hypothetical protein [Halorussus aquaticus]